MARLPLAQLAFRIILGVGFVAALPAWSQPGLRGNWEGVWTRDGAALPVTFAFVQGDSAITGSFGAVQLRAIGIPVSKISYRAPDVHFEIVGDFTTMVFDGQMKGDSIAGRFKDGSANGEFVLRRVPGAGTEPYSTEEIAFQNGGVKLAGSLLVPGDGRRRHPVILFMHGSGAEGRYASRFLADLFARQGIAALIFDKRGVGKSTGNWRESTFDDLAGDAIAGVEFLKSRRDIDARRIGIFGHSQGAAIAPLVASQSTAVSFVIASAASAVSMAEGERYSLQNSLGATDLSPDEAREAQRYVDLVVESGRAGRRTAGLDSAVARDSTARWAFAVPPNGSFYWTFSKEIADYNPATYWASVRVPVLLLYGAKDRRVKVDESSRNIKAALMKAHNDRYTVRVFPNADHTLRLTSAGGSGFAWPRNAPGYLETLTQWTLDVAKPKR
jgi:dipeptidyl aminopeptidase/acylaminoacyl peptidase